MLDYLQLKKIHLKSHNNQLISDLINFKDLFKTKNSMNTENNSELHWPIICT